MQTVHNRKATKKQKKPASDRLYNHIDKKILKQHMENSDEARTTFSFYRYRSLENTQAIRDDLYRKFSALGMLGRIYIAREGINAQFSLANKNIKAFQTLTDSLPFLRGVQLKPALVEANYSFYKLVIKVRSKIVADGLLDSQIDFSKKGSYLSPLEFHAKALEKHMVIVDVRNYYESEVGHFKNSITSDTSSFSQQISLLSQRLQGKEQQEILLYCTGGIRCEKASAYLANNGFQKVYQLEGGIIEYCHTVKQKNLPSLFIGKNFVFDNRLGERVTKKPIANCHQCGACCDTHRNCQNNDCHLLFIQCDSCYGYMQGCCSGHCKSITCLPLAEQRNLRRGKKKTNRLISHTQAYVQRKVEKLGKADG